MTNCGFSSLRLTSCVFNSWKERKKKKNSASANYKCVLTEVTFYIVADPTDDIEIIFRHGNWKANGEFAQTDVHRQIAIVFKTPPYQDQDIREEVEVSVFLRRLSDQMISEPVSFIYLPPNPGESDLNETLLAL